MENDTIDGYNSYLESQLGKKVRITTVLFDDKYEIINERKSINDVKKLTNKEYYVRGCIALLDAIGKSIEYIDRVGSKKVMFVITTDGYENASKKYNKEQIKELIEGHNNWEFIYIGANIDSYSEGYNLGIKKENISNYKKDQKGITKLFKSIVKVCDMFYEECVDKVWKSELEEYINENKS